MDDAPVPAAPFPMIRTAKAAAGGLAWFALGATVPADAPVAVAPRALVLVAPTGGAPRLAAPLAVGALEVDPRETEQGRSALAFNATVPLVQGALQPAAPFLMASSAEELARAADCLAAAQFYEAGRGAADQRAVAQVVLNRVRHRAFPATVCGVVFQGSERRTGCQFTFTCDGALARRDPSPEAWAEARRVAVGMLLGQVEPGVGRATHYHTDWVSPVWDRTMDKIAAVRTHLFYRWRGAQAFDQRHAGAEPRIAALARLSPAHGGGQGAVGATAAQLVAPVLPAAGAPSAMPSPSALPAPMLTVPRVPAPSTSGVFLATLPGGAAADSFPALAEKRCAGLPDCRFIAWADAARTPRMLPMPGSAVDAIAFVFTRRRGAETARWDCATFARADRGECIR